MFVAFDHHLTVQASVHVSFQPTLAEYGVHATPYLDFEQSHQKWWNDTL